jgi:HSP20 family protein
MQEKDNAQKKQAEEEVAVDFGINKISVGGLFQGIGSLIDFVSRMEEEGKEEVRREGEFTSPSGKVRASFSLSVKTGLGGTPPIKSFDNVRKTPRRPVVEGESQPLVDVFDEQDHVLLIVELPGVEEEHIHTEVNGDVFTLSAVSGNHKYYREVVLPKDVDASTLKSKYKNGVLKLRMSKR